jgi:fructokinase
VTFTSPGIAEYHIPLDVSHNFIVADDNIIEEINAEEFDMLCYGTFAQKGEISRKAIQTLIGKANTKHKFLDVNLRMEFHDRDVLDYSFSKADIVKINDEECAIVSKILFGSKMTLDGFAGSIMKRYNTEHILITLGAEGCAVYSGDRHELLTPPTVTVADTVGAGDAFSAGFIYSFLRGDDVFSAAGFGNTLGAFVASKEGATPKLEHLGAMP